jgi:hypothetical protein
VRSSVFPGVKPKRAPPPKKVSLTQENSNQSEKKNLLSLIYFFSYLFFYFFFYLSRCSWQTKLSISALLKKKRAQPEGTEPRTPGKQKKEDEGDTDSLPTSYEKVCARAFVCFYLSSLPVSLSFSLFVCVCICVYLCLYLCLCVFFSVCLSLCACLKRNGDFHGGPQSRSGALLTETHSSLVTGCRAPTCSLTTAKRLCAPRCVRSFLPL